MSYIRHRTYRSGLCINIPPCAIGRCPRNPRAFGPARPEHPLFFRAAMPLIALNKPFGTICQFSPHETRASLGDWVETPGVYPGRPARRRQRRPAAAHRRRHAGARGSPIRATSSRRPIWCRSKAAGVESDRRARAASRSMMARPSRPSAALDMPPEWLWPRDPPVRFRKSVADDLARTDDPRRPQPAGAAHDRRGRLADAAPGPHVHRPVRARGLAPGESMELPPRAPWDGIE